MTRPAPTDRPRCQRDGFLLDRTGKCWACGWSPEAQAQLESPDPQPPLSLVPSGESEESMAAKKAAETLEPEASPGLARAVGKMADVVRDGGVESFSFQAGDGDPVVIDQAAAERIKENVAAVLSSRRSANEETGEISEPDAKVFTQPTLSDELFPATRRRQVPMVKLAVSGSVEMTLADFQRYCSEGLWPGREVTMTVTGYLPDPHPKWVKRKETVPGLGGKRETVVTWELEGQIKVKVTDLCTFELGEELYSDE
jgi:hypothetical protein